MARTKGDTTKLVSAKTKSDSLRATVPSSIVRVLKLDEGDELHWEIKSIEDGIIVVKIKRNREEHNDET
ncbi:MAG: AbrB/MazE/SpoVT family DNA-binding domain-containing protein [Thermoplasmataceae archaeon]